MEGAGEEWSLFRKGSSADPPPVQQHKGERQAISGQELTLVATSAFLWGTAGHVGEAELPWGKDAKGSILLQTTYFELLGNAQFPALLPALITGGYGLYSLLSAPPEPLSSGVLYIVSHHHFWWSVLAWTSIWAVRGWLQHVLPTSVPPKFQSWGPSCGPQQSLFVWTAWSIFSASLKPV